eukprot:TRINITY_DN4770_c0_g3_i1.p1 TRINITY_DN4770_c0_g3~~TRINITY_DN4770_c0_g3_i1.p1  ORF type:complete len:148 (+),score=54.37 TRINITY_DN4770_c0_g3_i1:78-521(+)
MRFRFSLAATLILVLIAVVPVLSDTEKAAESNATEAERQKNHRKDFDEFDLNHDGKIVLEELKRAIEELTEEELRDFLEAADKNKDGGITFDEYLNAALQIDRESLGALGDLEPEAHDEAPPAEEDDDEEDKEETEVEVPSEKKEEF